MKTFNVDDKDLDKTITASVGDHIDINLAWNPSTGFFWQATDSTAGTLESIHHEGDSPVPGATAFVHFVFRVTGAGFVKLFYARPWDETTAPAKWWWLHVEIAKP